MDVFIEVYEEVDRMLKEAHAKEVAEVLRTLAFQLAYCERYGKRPTKQDREVFDRLVLEERDEDALAVLVEWVRHLKRVLQELRAKGGAGRVAEGDEPPDLRPLQ